MNSDEYKKEIKSVQSEILAGGHDLKGKDQWNLLWRMVKAQKMQNGHDRKSV